MEGDVTSLCWLLLFLFLLSLLLTHTHAHAHAHEHAHPFNGPFSVTTRVGRYQKGKTNLEFTEARDSEWQWHQLGHMQVCTLLQTDNHASTPPLKFFTGRMPFLLPNQQRQSTEGQIVIIIVPRVIITHVLIIVTLSRKRSRADLL